VGGNLDEDNQSFLNVDTASGQFCLAGLAQGTDTDPLPNRLVVFQYDSLGTIKKENAKRVTATFVTVNLRLTITENGSTPYDESILSVCKLKGKLQKAGDQAKARLKCDVGENFSAFPDVADFLDTINDAFPKAGQKHIKVNTAKGKLRITHNGRPDVGGLVDLTCPPILPEN
jgi:hypothetical protein